MSIGNLRSSKGQGMSEVHCIVELSSRLYHPRKSILFLNYSEFNSALKTDEECSPHFKKSFSSLSPVLRHPSSRDI